jgi:hypothetical protein
MKNIESARFREPFKKGQYGDGFYVRNDGVSGNDDTNPNTPNPNRIPS